MKGELQHHANPASAIVEHLAKAFPTFAAFDANKDGRVNWDAPEGGLQQAQMHVDLLKKGEGQGQ